MPAVPDLAAITALTDDDLLLAIDGATAARKITAANARTYLGAGATVGGDLTGTVANAQIAAGAVGATELAALAVTDAKVATANKDGAAGTASMRTLGTGAAQAAPGNHQHPASDLVSGTIATARLGSGSASASTFLRGDQTWATGPGGGGTSRTVRTPEQDGALGDGRFIFDGQLTSTTALTSANDAVFVAGTTPTGDVGKKIWIAGGGALDGDTGIRLIHEATISTRPNATQITFTPAAATTASNLVCLIGTNDAVAVQTWLNRASATVELRATDKVYCLADSLATDGTGESDMLLNLGNAEFASTVETNSGFRFDNCTDGLEINGGKVSMFHTSTRGNGGDLEYKLKFFNCSRLRVQDVVIDGSYAAGFFANYTDDFLFTNCTSRNTRADAFHFTQGCRNGRVTDCSSIGMSDDGMAIVSSGFSPVYDPDTICRNIIVTRHKVWYSRNHALPANGTWGRGMTMVGADQCAYYDCEIYGSGQAGIYAACEQTDYDSHLTVNCTFEGIKITNCCRNPAYTQGSIHIFNERSTAAMRNLVFKRIEVVDTEQASGSFHAARINNAAGGGVTRLVLGTTDGPIRLTGQYDGSSEGAYLDLGGVTPISKVFELGPQWT